MFEHYQLEVFAEYKKRRSASALRLNLLHPTPARLRSECIAVLAERPLERDEATLRKFFGRQADWEEYHTTIRRFDADKFKPLVKFLREETADTDAKNIELLAWLIDFEPRPYRFDAYQVAEKRPLPHSPETAAGPAPPQLIIELPANAEPIPVQPDDEKVVTHASKRKYYIPTAFLFLILTGTFWYWLHSPAVRKTPPAQSGCMLWRDNHYITAKCDPLAFPQPVSVDSIRLKYFRKLTDRDTPVLFEEGELWYFKTGNHLELYTGGGQHPVFKNRRLLPLTYYMFNKYIRKK